MAVETATTINQLDATLPLFGDPKSEGDDHIRLLKSTVKATFPNVTGVVTPTHTELNRVAGVTSGLQTQLDNKQPLDSDLTAIAALSGNGLIAKTGAGTAATRQIAVGTGLLVTNADGVAGNPTINIDLAGFPNNANGVAYTPAGTGAVATTVQAKLRQTVSVLDYGADPTGATDSRTAIVNAIATGQDVYFPKGLYRTDSGITITTSNQRIYGDRDAIIRRNGSHSIFRLATTANNNSIEELRFDGNKANYPFPTYPRGSVIWVEGDNTVIENCRIENGNSHGILFSTAGNPVSNVVDGCTVLNCDEVGIAHDGGTDNRIVNSSVSGCGFEGLTLDQSSFRCVVDGNRFNANCQSGGVGAIGVDGTDLCIISNNIIAGTQSGLSGITFQNNLGPSNSNVISGNVFDANGGYGIELKTNTGGSCDSNTITGNIFRTTNTLGSVFVGSGCQGNAFAGNFYGVLPNINAASFNNLENGLVYFRATNTVTRTDVTGNNTTYQIPFNNLANERNATASFNTTTGTFTAPLTGIYSFSASCRTTGGSVADFAVIQIVTSAGTFQTGLDYTDKANQNCTVSGTIVLQRNQTAHVTIRVGGEASNVVDVSSSANETYFTGVLIG